MRRYAKPVAAAVAMVLAGASGAALAEAPKLSEVLEASGITLNGYVAASYFHSTETNAYHNFDTSHDTFQLDQAGFTAAYQPAEGFGALVNVIAGEDARVINFAESALHTSPDKNTVNVTQAFVQYAGGPLTVIAGKYVTLAGAEVIAPTGNTNFSRSLLFFAEPLTHTGVRASFKANDIASFSVGVNNGWNYTSTSTSPKTAEIGVSLTPVKALALTAQAYVGKDPLFDASRKFFDAVATITATDMLSFVVSYDWGKQEQVAGPSLKWQGVAGYVNVKFNDMIRLSVRGEYLDDKDGFISGADQKLKEATVTLGIAPVESFELRVEARYDKAPETTIPKFRPTPTGAQFTDNQKEFAVQGVYKF